MARPKKEGMEYFSHDTDAVNDEKIEAMRALFGNDGYAFYFILLERIYRTDTGELDVSSFTIRTVLISKLGIKQEQFEPMLHAAFDIGLFDRSVYEERMCITSTGIKRRFLAIDAQRKKWREKKAEPRTTEVQSSIPNQNESFPKGKQELSSLKSAQRKVKESKGNNKDIVEQLDPIPFSEIIDHLNLCCGTNYKHTTEETKRLIRARFNAGFTLDDFIKVITIKSAEWLNDNAMRKYLRPSTLFGTKFESYLNQSTNHSESTGKNGQAIAMLDQLAEEENS